MFPLRTHTTEVDKLIKTAISNPRQIQQFANKAEDLRTLTKTFQIK